MFKKINEYYFLIGLLFISLLNNFLSIQYFKIFYIDDAWSASYSYHFFKTGENFDVLAREIGMILAHGNLLDYFYGFFMNLFPHSYFIHKYISLFLGFYFLFILYKVFSFFVKDKIVILKTLVLISFLEYFVLSSHLSRADLLGVSLVFSAFYLFIKDNKWSNYFFGSLLLGIGIDIHFATLIGVFLFIGYEVLYRNFSLNNWKIYLLAIFGFLLGNSVWIIDHYKDFNKVIEAYNFLKSVSVNQTFSDRILFLYKIGIESKYYRHFLYLFIFIASFLLFFKIKENRKLFILFLFAFAGFLILGRLSIFYFWYFFPILYLYFVYTIHKIRFGKIIYYGLIIYHLIFWGVIFKKYHNANYNLYANKIKKLSKNYVNKNTLIIAPANIWFIFKDNEFLSYNAKVDLKKTIHNRENILFIINEPLWDYLKYHKYIGVNTGVEKFNAFMLKQFKLIGIVKDKYYGAFGLKFNNITRIYYKGKRNE